MPEQELEWRVKEMLSIRTSPALAGLDFFNNRPRWEGNVYPFPIPATVWNYILYFQYPNRKL